MNILSLLFLLLGIVFILMGYLEMYFNSKKVEKKIEYRFIPRDVYNNINSNDLEEQFSFMNDSSDVRNNTNLV